MHWLGDGIDEVFSYEVFNIEGAFVFEHVVDGTGDFVGEDGVSFEFAAALAGEVIGKGCDVTVVSFGKDGGFSEDPTQVGVAELGSAQSFDFSGAGDGAFDQATVAAEALNIGEALDGIDLVDDGKAEGLANSGHGAHEGELERHDVAGGGDELFFELLDGVVVGGDEHNFGLNGEAVVFVIVIFEQLF